MPSTPIDLYALSLTKVRNENGLLVTTGSLWAEKKTVLVFLRHFACLACRAHAVQVWEHREAYEKSNVRLVFIGNGAPSFIGHFKADLKLDGADIFTDPTLEAFRACGFKRGFLQLVNPSTIVNGAKLLAAGHRQGKIEKGVGDHWQLGGVLVVTPENRIAFHFISEAFGDFPPEKDVVSGATNG